MSLTFDQLVSRHDAEFIHDHLDPVEVASVVLINPPFSPAAKAVGAIAMPVHAICDRHLLRLADRGRCVALMSPAFARDGTGAKGYEAVCAVVQPRFEIYDQWSALCQAWDSNLDPGC